MDYPELRDISREFIADQHALGGPLGIGYTFESGRLDEEIRVVEPYASHEGNLLYQTTAGCEWFGGLAVSLGIEASDEDIEQIEFAVRTVLRVRSANG